MKSKSTKSKTKISGTAIELAKIILIEEIVRIQNDSDIPKVIVPIIAAKNRDELFKAMKEYELTERIKRVFEILDS